jgi:hypothetical protein
MAFLIPAMEGMLGQGISVFYISGKKTVWVFAFLV